MSQAGWAVTTSSGHGRRQWPSHGHCQTRTAQMRDGGRGVFAQAKSAEPHQIRAVTSATKSSPRRSKLSY